MAKFFKEYLIVAPLYGAELVASIEAELGGKRRRVEGGGVDEGAL